MDPHAKKKDGKKPPAQEIDKLRSELEKMKDLAGRAQADLQNAKDRLASEAENMRKFATLSILSELLPIVDNLQRAFAHLPEELKDNDWVKGIEATEKDLMKKLSEAGIKKIESLGNPVDSEKHEVLQTGPGEKGEIIEVFEEGYECNGRILRPAKVKVGDGS